MHNKLGVISNNIKSIKQLKQHTHKIAAFLKYLSLSEWEISQKRSETISIIKNLINPHSKTHTQRIVLEESECATVYKMLFNTMGKISIHEFMKSLKDILSIEIAIHSAKLLLSRINYKVSLNIIFNTFRQGN